MKTTLRIPQPVLLEAREDLVRPHPFALERVGFFRCRPTGRPDLVVVTGYDAIPDDHYIENTMAGACIGSTAIRSALQRVLTYGVGQIHVHLHEHHGPPGPSSTDMANQPRLVESLRNLDGKVPHGCMILSRTHAWGLFTLPGLRGFAKLTKCSVVSGRIEFL